MNTPVVYAAGRRSLALRPVLYLGWLLVTLWSHRATAQDVVPLDVYGRPLADQLGPIDYRQEGENWIAVHADGSREPAPPIGAEGPVTPPREAVVSGYGLDSYSSFNVGSHAYAVAIGDVTGDGHADVLMTTTSYFDPVNDYSLFLFPQQASGTFGTPLRFPYLVHAGLTGLVLADLDEDGVQDVVVGHNSGITVFLADRQGSLLPGVIVYDADAWVLQAADFDRDGHVDIISLGQTRGGTIFFGDGRGGFPRKLPLATHTNGFNDFEAADMNGDGHPDVAVLDGATSPSVNLSVHRNDGAGGFVPPDTYLIDPNLWRGGIGVGDITGDGLNDAVVSRPRNTPTWLWIMTQDDSGRLTGPTAVPSYDIPEPVVVADLDRDGREDVAVLHGGWNRVGVYLQTPDGRLSAEALYTSPYASHYGPQGLAIGDFTSDGCPDVAIADFNSGLVVLRGHGCTPHCATEPCDDLNPCTDDSCDPAIGCVHTNNTNPCDDGNACTTNDTCAGADCHGGGSNTCAGTMGMFTDSSGVVVFDADADTSLTRIAIYSPKDCSVDAGQMLGFVTDGQSNVWVIDLTKTPPRLATGVDPIRISNRGGDTTISPDQRYLLVCGGATGQPLSVVDVVRRREIGTVPMETSCTSLEACTDGSVVVTSSSDRKVRRFTIDGAGHLTDTGEQLTTPSLGPYNSICGPKSRTGVYLARETMGSFAIPGTVRIDSRNLSNYTFSGALNRSGNRLFLRTINQVMAYAYDETTGSLGSAPIFSFYPNVNSGGYPGADEIAVHPDGTKFYTLGSAPLINMNVYSTDAGQQLASIPAEGYPSAVCFRSMECVPEAPLQCADGDACTADACDALGQCTHVPVVCDDGSVCTVDTCDPATGCVFTPAVCDDRNECTTEHCDPVMGCAHTDNSDPCDDGNACTSDDTCGGGHCQPGGPTNCGDANCCTVDSCDPAAGCIHGPNTTAPAFTIHPSLGDCPTLWPPDHKYVEFTVSQTGAAAAGACGIASIEFASCLSNQPENGTGTADGNTVRDCVYEPYVLHLRAERDGACSPIGRVYEARLLAVDVCGNTALSAPLEVGVYHDRGHSPPGGRVYSASDDSVAAGTNGTYGAGCGSGNTCVNGSSGDDSDANPEMEIAQQAAVDVDDLRLSRDDTGDVGLTWGPPVQIGQVTRFHVWRLDPLTLFWTQIAEVSKQTNSYRDPTLNDGRNWQYKVTAVIK